jgi:hypothetical protein
MQDAADREALPFYLRPAALAVLVAALTLLRLWSASNAHFVEDEAYYRLWGLAPAAGYLDHPPMIGWWIWIGQNIFGDTVFGTRALVALSSALGTLALWRTGYLLFGRRVAGWAVLFINASILVGVGGILATPDAPSVLFWGLCLWALAELQASRNPSWWLAVGLFAGLGLLSKYSVLFLGVGILFWLLWVPDARRWFTSWQLWAGGALALLLFCPVLYWNHLHEWASFHKQFGRVGRGDWTTKYIFEFLGALLGLMNPLIAIPAVLGSWQLGRKTLNREPAASLLVLTVLPFLGYLLYHSLQTRVQANWPAPLFPAFALMAAVHVGGVTRGGAFWRNWSLAGVGLGIAVAVVVQVHAVHPLTASFARKDPTFQLRGWPEIGREVRRLAKETGAGYIATTGYGLNGQLSYLLKDTLPVIQLNERIRYDMFPDPDPELFRQTGLYITEERRDRSAALSSEFSSIDLIATIPRTVRGTFLENLIVYEVSGPIDDPLGYESD